jgi:hypothetical protein
MPFVTDVHPDLLLDASVLLVGLVVLVSQAPLVTREHLARLEHAQDLREDLQHKYIVRYSRILK